MSNSNMLVLLKKAIPLLNMAGLNVDELIQNSLQFLPQFFMDQKKVYQDQFPDLKVVIMIVDKLNDLNENELWLVPVGIDGIVIKEQFKPVNLNELISNIKISEVLESDDPGDKEDNIDENFIS